MFSKINAIPKKVNQHSNLQITKYHATNIQLSKSNSKWDNGTLAIVQSKALTSHGKIVKSKDNFILLNSISKSNLAQVNKYIKSLSLIVIDSYDKSLKAYEMALKHDCYHDIISRNEVDNTVTVAFLPISTSDNNVSCGTQEFNKIHVNINLRGYKTFYITRLLFHKTMPVDEYNKWLLESQKWYQDTKLRKAIFNEIQKDLDANHYSLLKDSDLIKPNAEFLSNELPLVKFKFTELEL